MRNFTSNNIKKSLFLFAATLLCSTMLAQPSGGPYGPLRQKYDLPKVKGKTFYVAVDGKKR